VPSGRKRSGPPVELAHAIPGRMRLRIPRLRQDEDLAEALSQKLADSGGFKDVDVKPARATVVVSWSQNESAQEEVIERLASVLAAHLPDCSEEQARDILGGRSESGSADEQKEQPTIRETLSRLLGSFHTEIERRFQVSADNEGRILFEHRVQAPVGGRIHSFRLNTRTQSEGRTHRTKLHVHRVGDDSDCFDPGPLDIHDGQEICRDVEFKVQPHAEYVIHLSSEGFEPNEQVEGSLAAEISSS